MFVKRKRRCQTNNRHFFGLKILKPKRFRTKAGALAKHNKSLWVTFTTACQSFLTGG